MFFAFFSNIRHLNEKSLGASVTLKFQNLSKKLIKLHVELIGTEITISKNTNIAIKKNTLIFKNFRFQIRNVHEKTL